MTRAVRKKDALIVLAALALAAAALLTAIWGRGGATDSVRIYVDGALYAEMPLNEDGEIRVEQADGSVNVVAVEDGAAFMAYSSCKNQLCVQQGRVSAGGWALRALGRQIICLPNRVTVEMCAGTIDPNAPDV